MKKKSIIHYTIIQIYYIELIRNRFESIPNPTYLVIDQALVNGVERAMRRAQALSIDCRVQCVQTGRGENALYTRWVSASFIAVV